MPKHDCPPPTSHGASPAAVQRALVVAPAWIGDAVMAQSLFIRLHERASEIAQTVELDALAPPWVAPVLRRMPQIRTVIEAPFAHGELALGARWTLARELARAGYARAYILPNSAKSALIPCFAGIPERIGFTGEARYGLINRRHRLDAAALPQMVQRFVQLAESPGVALDTDQPIAPPRLASSPAQQAATRAELKLPRTGKVAVFCPGAEYGPAKRWPAEYFAALADLLARRGYALWLLGSAKDRAIGDAIVADASPAARGVLNNLCGATSLVQAIDLIAGADLVVCNDSGLMHVAAALDRPLVALYGSSSATFTPPLSGRAQRLEIDPLDLPCRPCFKRECPLGHLACLRRIEPQRVLDACLAGQPPGETP
jgi:heptosyltransferase-2